MIELNELNIFAHMLISFVNSPTENTLRVIMTGSAASHYQVKVCRL